MIYIVRHGQTEANRRSIMTGRAEYPLSETGIDQARTVGDWFRGQGIRFAKVYSSPLSRAVDTARLISGAPDEEIVRDDRLLEMDYGPYEGIDLRNLPEALKEFFSDFIHNPAPEGMEQLDEVTARLGTFLEDIKDDICGDILISTHAIAMKGALEYLSPDESGAFWSRYIGNCEVYGVEMKNGAFERPRRIEIKNE